MVKSDWLLFPTDEGRDGQPEHAQLGPQVHPRVLPRQRAVAFPQAVAELRASVGLPSGLAAAGIQSAHLPLLADKAWLDACHQSNPRACTRDDLLTLYEASL